MPRIEVPAAELSDVSVSFVSLVKRASTRIPFRVVKGDADVAGFDLASFMFRKADAEEAARVAAKKAEDILAGAMDIVKAAGFTIQKSEPASDGSGADTTSNPATGSDAGGPRNDGTGGADETKNPTDGTEAGEPRNDGTGKSTVKKAECPPEEEPTKPAPNAPPAAAAEADPEEDPAAAKAPVKKTTKKADKKPPVDDGDGEDTEDEEDAASEKDKPAFLKADLDAAFADLKAMFKKSSDELAAQVTELQTGFTAMGERVQKAEAAAAETGARLSAMVPGRAAPEAEPKFRKSDDSLPPPLDTAYGS